MAKDISKIKDIETHLLEDKLGFKFEKISHSNEYDVSKLHRHNYWEIFIFEEGDGAHTIDFLTTPFFAKSLHFILPNQVHQLSRNPISSGYVLMFLEDFFLSRNESKSFMIELGNYQLNQSAPIIYLTDESFASLLSLITMLEKDYFSSEAMKLTILGNYLNIIFCKCQQFIQQTATVESNKNIAAIDTFLLFRNLVEQNFRAEHKIEFYTAKLFLTDKKLREIVTTFTGLTSLEYLHQRIVQEAKRLLIYDQLPPKEVVYQLNFSDFAHFSKFFKQKTGILPSNVNK